MSLPLFSLGRRLVAIVTLITCLVLLMAAPASAHTGFESSSPSDGDTVDGPVSEISLTFSGPAEPAGEGFVVLDPNGVVRSPDDVTSTDDLTWTLHFNEPLAGGTIGLRWQVAAPDTHPIEGSFSFTVTALAAAAPASTPTPADTATGGVDTSEVAQEQASSVELADFLDTGSVGPGGVARVGNVGRAMSLLGVVLAIGGVAFAAFTLRGDRSDIRAVLFWVRRAALVTMLSVVLEGAAQVANVSSGWSGLWSPSAVADVVTSSFGAALMLRFLGGGLIAVGAIHTMHAAEGAPDPVVAVKQFAGVGAGASMAYPAPKHADTVGGEPFLHEGDEAWHISRSPAAFVGSLILIGSFLFDGHTVSEGPRWIHAVANAIHVATAATWAGGVVMLALVIARRHRRNADTRALQLAVRFSVVATIALIAAATAGTVLAVVILDSVSELWSTPWGQLLVAKVLLVGVVGTGGLYNHKVVIPALEQTPNDAAVAHRFRAIVSCEAAGLIAVTVLTALLISASSA